MEKIADVVRDAAHILQVIVGFGQHHDYTYNTTTKSTPRYFGSCKVSATNWIRLEIPRNVIVLQSCEIFGPKIEAVSPVLRTLCKAGAVIIDNTNVVTAKNHRKLNIPDGL